MDTSDLVNKCNEVWEYDHDEVNSMMTALGGEYLKLTKPRGVAHFDLRQENWQQLDFLKGKGHYVNKFEEKDGQYYVTFKQS